MTNKKDSNVVVDGDDVEAQAAAPDYTTHATASNSPTRNESTDYANGEGGDDGGAGGGGDQPMSNEEEEEEKLLPPPKGVDLPVSKKLFTDRQLYSISLWAVRMAVLTDSINTTVSGTTLQGCRPTKP